MEINGDVFEVDTLLQALEHLKTSEDSVSKNFSKRLVKWGGKCHEENLNTEGDEKLCNKSFSFDGQVEAYEPCPRDERLRAASCERDNENNNSEGEEEGASAYRDLLHKRGPYKLVRQSPHPSSPYRPSRSEATLQRWVSEPRDVGPDQFQTSVDTEQAKCQAIDRLVQYLSDPEEKRNRNTVRDILEDMDSWRCQPVWTDRLLDDLLDMALQPPSESSSPVHVPDRMPTSPPQDFSPQSSTSTESGYVSDSPDCKSRSNSPIYGSELYAAPPAESHFSSVSVLPRVSIATSDRHLEQTVPAVAVEAAKEKRNEIFDGVASDSHLERTVPAVAVEAAKKKRNEFFDGVDSKARDRCRRNIRMKENSKGGLDQKDDQGRTILHVAIENGEEIYALTFISMVEKSFQSDSRRNGLQQYTSVASFFDQTDAYGCTPLLLACDKNMSRVADYLLRCGASGTLHSHGSVLHYVCERGNRFFEVAEVLCGSQRSKEFIEMRNGRGETPLHVAVSKHNREHLDEKTQTKEVVDNRAIVGLLLEKGADLCARDGLGRTALHGAVCSNNPELVCKLHASAYRKSWSQAIDLQDAEGMTVLHRAVLCRGLSVRAHRGLVDRLIALGASSALKDAKGRLPEDYVPGTRLDLAEALDSRYYTALMTTGNHTVET